MNKFLFVTLSFLCFSLLAIDLSKDDLKELKASYRVNKKIPYPKNNPYSKRKYELGKILFFDPRISSSGTISCASCHNPLLGFEDGLQLGLGHGMKVLSRHSPTVINLAWSESFFWDGRAKTLEEQSLMPIESENEMNMSLEVMEKKLSSFLEYRNLFKSAFKVKKISKKEVSMALATFERSLNTWNAPFDDWVNGKTNLSKDAVQGFILFNTKGNCSSCHSGWRFTDDSFHDIGLITSDEGRFLASKDKKLKFAFKTPTLRNISQRSPYMHNGSLKTLEEVVEHYNKGGEVKRRSLSSEISPLELTEKEIKQIVTFLRTLTSDIRIELPHLPEK